MAHFNKDEARHYILTTAKDLILTQFDKTDKRNQIKEFKENNYTISIKKSCTSPNSKFKVYSEDYHIQFTGKIQGKSVEWSFYLQRAITNDYSIIELIDPKGTSQNKLTIRHLKH